MEMIVMCGLGELRRQDNLRFPSEVTTRRATARAKAKAPVSGTADA
jgi:hypothetical protein